MLLICLLCVIVDVDHQTIAFQRDISTKNENDTLLSKKNENSHLVHSELFCTSHRCRVQMSSQKNENWVIMPASHCCWAPGCRVQTLSQKNENRVIMLPVGRCCYAAFLFCLQMRRALACHVIAQSSIACRCSSLRLAACANQQAKSTHGIASSCSSGPIPAPSFFDRSVQHARCGTL
jgi:hypothetical protein